MQALNQYTKNLNRIEFVITMACTGKCKHCSQGEHKNGSGHIDGEVGADVVKKISNQFNINSLMTFGGEPLLYPDIVCKIHAAAREAGIPKRQLITNGFFNQDKNEICRTTSKITESGVNEILLSVDAFHQETIPIEIVKVFAKEILQSKIRIRTQPAWLVSREDDNVYNKRTREVLKEFSKLGIEENSGNIIFPSGNAVKYLSEYFTYGQIPKNPYIEEPTDITTLSICENGNVLNGNVYETDIIEIIKNYFPYNC